MTGWIENDTSSFNKAYVVKIDMNGAIIWKRFYGGLYDNAIFDILEIDSGNFILVGTKMMQIPPPILFSIYVIEIDGDGQEKWSRNYDSTGKGSRIEEIPDNGFFICGNRTMLIDYEGKIIHSVNSLGNGVKAINDNGFLFAMNTISI